MIVCLFEVNGSGLARMRLLSVDCITGFEMSSGTRSSSISSMSRKSILFQVEYRVKVGLSMFGIAFDHALSGLTAGAVTTTILHPLDLIKTRMQGK